MIIWVRELQYRLVQPSHLLAMSACCGSSSGQPLLDSSRTVLFHPMKLLRVPSFLEPYNANTYLHRSENCSRCRSELPSVTGPGLGSRALSVFKA